MSLIQRMIFPALAFGAAALSAGPAQAAAFDDVSVEVVGMSIAGIIGMIGLALGLGPRRPEPRPVPVRVKERDPRAPRR